MWQYEVVDDYLDKKTFDSFIEDLRGVKLEDNEVYRRFFTYDPTPQIAELVNKFEIKRPCNNYKKLIHYAVTPANFFHKEHYEADFKIMSAIVYLSPEKNIGTTLVDYRTPGPNEGDLYEKITLDWKPNRMMTFCGLDDITWHYYESTDVRFTYNYFLVDPDKIQSDEWKQHLID